MATLSSLPRSYSEAAEFLGKRDEKQCGRNTTVLKNTEWIGDKRITTYSVKYYSTVIVTLYPDNSVKICTRSYKSATTRSRINKILWRSNWSILLYKSEMGLYNQPSRSFFPFKEGDRVFLNESKLIDCNAIYEDIQSTGYGLMMAMILERM